MTKEERQRWKDVGDAFAAYAATGKISLCHDRKVCTKHGLCHAVGWGNGKWKPVLGSMQKTMLNRLVEHSGPLDTHWAPHTRAAANARALFAYLLSEGIVVK